MPKSCKLLSNKKVIHSIIDMFRSGVWLTSRDVSGLSNNPTVCLTESRVHRILIMLKRRGILTRYYDKDFKQYRYFLTSKSVLFDLEEDKNVFS